MPKYSEFSVVIAVYISLDASFVINAVREVNLNKCARTGAKVNWE